MKIDKLFKKDNFIIVVLCGILLCVASMPTNSAKNQTLFGETEEKSREENYLKQTEERFRNMLLKMQDVENAEVMLTVETEGNFYMSYENEMNPQKVVGVCVAVKGREGVNFTKNITEMAQALFGVEAHKIKIVKMK